MQLLGYLGWLLVCYYVFARVLRVVARLVWMVASRAAP